MLVLSNPMIYFVLTYHIFFCCISLLSPRRQIDRKEIDRKGDGKELGGEEAKETISRVFERGKKYLFSIKERKEYTLLFYCYKAKSQHHD